MRAKGGRLNLRLLFVIKSLAGAGGAERVLCALAGELAERGHDVEIASFDAPGSSNFYPLDRRVARLHLGIGKVARSSGPLDLLRQAAALRALLRKSRPDVAIGFMHSAFVPLGLAAMGTGVPVVASEHTVFDHYRANRVQGALVRATTGLIAAFTATSDRVRAGFPPGIAARMTVIPNPVLSSDAVTRRDSSAPHVLLSVGGLRQEKGHDVLIEAFAKLADRFPHWSLRIVGEGPRREALEIQARNAGVGARVTFAGTIADVGPEYSAADLFVVPSSYESFGLATAEALAAAIPAVGFADCPGTNEIIRDEVNGVLVSGPDRSEALALGLARLMGDQELRSRLGQAGPNSVAGYSLAPLVDRWEELLLRVVRQN
jgi:GalNAc-alpha-(1->4)-GalNAc-alpha-(1->3)-diNAcBac-PP-undecaprenol alpha-1,4-N-acetyl-D-galactosaminyltransferase